MHSEASGFYYSDMSTSPATDVGRVLVSGGTGYVGGRLVPELLARSYRVRVMVFQKTPDLDARWPGAEIVEADGMDINRLRVALDDVQVAYYLIHTMLIGQRRFARSDLQTAMNFRQVAEECRLDRIIYLGGLGRIDVDCDSRLHDRMAVGDAFAQSAVSATILRTGCIVGSGSASYEMIEYVVRNLTVQLLPPWTRLPMQPIGIRDLVKYLVGVLEVKASAGKSFDVGGLDCLSYADLLHTMAELLHKKKFFISLPFNLKRLYAYMTGLFSPVPQPLAHCIVEGYIHSMTCRENLIRQLIPFEPLSCREIFRRAFQREQEDAITSRWSDAYPPAFERSETLSAMTSPPSYSSEHSLLSVKSPAELFASICSIGGHVGWFNSSILWNIRGWFDRLMMGVGTVRGRRSTATLRINDVIDFWRVEDLQPERRLLLRAEMKLPGKGWLEFRVTPEKDKSRLSVKAYFYTGSFFGKLYWYFFLPSHAFIFNDLIRQIEKRS